MKNLLLSCIALLLLSTSSHAQTAVEKITLKGDVYTVCKNFPPEILGRYLYEGKGEPIVELNANGEGLFQAHMVPPLKIKFWIDCDEKGVLRRQEGPNGNYGYTLLIQYQESGTGGYKAGEYNLMGVGIAKAERQAVIYGERFKPIP